MRTDFTALAQNVDNELAELTAKHAANLMRRKELLREPHLTDPEVTAFGVELDRVFTAHHELNRFIAALREVHSLYNWNRAWIVSGGHVHNTPVGCPGFKYNTQVHLLPECSGLTQDEIVDLAGERACTHCYPSAPLSALQQASKLFAPDEAAKTLKVAEKRSKADEKRTKEVRIQTGPNSQQIFGTVRSAKIEAANEIWWTLYSMVYNGHDVTRQNHRLEAFRRIAEAVTAHRDGGVSHIDALIDELITKASTKFVREGKKSVGSWDMTIEQFQEKVAQAIVAIKEF